MRGDGRREFILARLLKGNREVARNIFFFVRHRELLLPHPNLKVRRLRDAIEVSTDVFAKGVWPHSRQREIPLEDNYFDLVPGEKRVVRARAGTKLPAGRISAAALY